MWIKNFARWVKVYLWIVGRMRYSVLKDLLSSFVLSFKILGKGVPLVKLKPLIANRVVFIFGGSSLLAYNLKRLLESGLLQKYRGRVAIISADSATYELARNGVYPDVIVTDLDGDVKSILIAHVKHGSILVVHGHGDNIDLIVHFTKYFKSCVGTCQTVPFLNVYNTYGFTDGDRAIYLALKLGASRVYLFGMNFKGEVGRYPKLRCVEDRVKRAKLMIGYALYRLADGKVIDLSERLA